MASDVDVCNLALSHLGDEASVSSLSPPEGSSQAQHCAQFLPIARDALLEMHPWNFATTRTAALAALSVSPASTFRYAYPLPANTLKTWAVFDANAPDDLYGAAPSYDYAYSSLSGAPVGMTSYAPVEFEVETADDGTPIVLTNQSPAVAKITKRVSDITRFSPMAVLALSWKLAAYLAGPVLRGEAGRAATKECEAMFQYHFSLATRSDAEQRRRDNLPLTPWIAGR